MSWTPSQEPLDLPLLAVVREEPSLVADVIHGVPPGSPARGALAAAADSVLARCFFAARRGGGLASALSVRGTDQGGHGSDEPPVALLGRSTGDGRPRRPAVSWARGS